MNGLILEKPTTLVDSVEASISNYIRTNGLVAGDKLPSEEEFAESLGVSRNVVREALSRMKSFGMLSSRKKRGLVLQTVNEVEVAPYEAYHLCLQVLVLFAQPLVL